MVSKPEISINGLGEMNGDLSLWPFSLTFASGYLKSPNAAVTPTR